MRFRADRDFRRGVAQRVCRAPPGPAQCFSGPDGSPGWRCLQDSRCSPGWRSAQHGRRPTLREQSALPILPRGAEFGLSLWSFLLLVGFTWNFGSHFELWNRRAGWDQAARPSSPDTDAVSGSTMPDAAWRHWKPHYRGSRCLTGQIRSERFALPTLQSGLLGFCLSFLFYGKTCL